MKLWNLEKHGSRLVVVCDECGEMCCRWKSSQPQLTVRRVKGFHACRKCGRRFDVERNDLRERLRLFVLSGGVAE